MNKTIKVFAPATIANFIVGFDCLGVAIHSVNGLNIGDTVEIQPAKSLEFELRGKYAGFLPKSAKKNLVMMAVDVFYQHLNTNAQPNFKIILEKNMPVGSGMGSSSSSSVAALVALNKYHKNPFSKQKLLTLAGIMEGKVSGAIHYDNVAPALLGGVQLITSENEAESLPFFDNWHFVIYNPGTNLQTKLSRKVLPSKIKLKSAVEYYKHLSTFVHALHDGNEALAMKVMKDCLIEPHRRKLIKNFRKMQQTSLNSGAFAFSIAGSGPTCIAITKSYEEAQVVEQQILSNIKGNDLSFSRICKVSKQGAREV